MGPEPSLDIILISIPEVILKSCRSQKYKHTNKIFLLKRQFSKLGLKDFRDGYNFHNILKVIGLEKHIPTQLIYPNTLIPNPKSKGRQDIAMIAWNLTVAFLYKANEIPWKYFDFPDDTCFIGISFHREYDDSGKQIMRASIAQTFLSDGKDIILRGKRFEWDDTKIKSPHMTTEYAESLIEEILSHYSKIRDDPLKRVVIHKSSAFWDEETQGLKKALRDVPKIDLITISNTNLRFFRYGQETLVRGTFIEFFGKYYLYNVGFIPCLNIYPGSRIPTPLEIQFYQTNQDKITICKEIMALARLNWNNIDYSTKEPVTLTFSRIVGEILSEYRAISLDKPPEQYKYYM